ncbi:MAG: hypothetical protein PHW00_03125 [Clostridia bacterium]|nr:hypothetical protein [Clostridia bacterium]
MRKLNCYTLIVVILATMLLSMSGCYIVDGGRMQDVIGTYQLTVCNTQENDSEGLIDLLTLNGIECYLVVGDEGYGFIVYADNETTLLCRQVKLTYGFSSEDDTLIEYVSYVDAECEYEEKLAYNGKSKQLNKTQLAITIGTISTNYGQTTYSKVSEATDLSYVEEQLGELDYTPYELVRESNTQ